MEFLNRFIKAAALIAVNIVRQWVQKANNGQVADAQPLQTTPNTNNTGNQENTSGSNAGNTAVINTNGGVPTPTIFDFQPSDIQYTSEDCFLVPSDPVNLWGNEDDAQVHSVVFIPTPYDIPPISLTFQPSCDGPEPVIVASLADRLGPRPLFDPVLQAAWDRTRAEIAVGESFDIQGNWTNPEIPMEEQVRRLMETYNVHPSQLVFPPYIPLSPSQQNWQQAVFNVAKEWGFEQGGITGGYLAVSLAQQRAGYFAPTGAQLVQYGIDVLTGFAVPVAANRATQYRTQVWQQRPDGRMTIGWQDVNVPEEPVVASGEDLPLGNPVETSSSPIISEELTTVAVWDNIITTEENIPGTLIPRNFRFERQGIFVINSGTKHMGEHLTRGEFGTSFHPINSQAMLASLESAVDAATGQGIIYDTRMQVNGWELIFGAEGHSGPLPVLYHAVWFGRTR